MPTKVKMEHEFIICSAIRLPDGKLFRGNRHFHCIKAAYDFVTWNGGDNPGEHHWMPEMSNGQGFITSRNRYVGREEAMILQLAAGIESVWPEGGYRGKQLYSEDLY